MAIKAQPAMVKPSSGISAQLRPSSTPYMRTRSMP
jgi:hypothetical protein